MVREIVVRCDVCHDEGHALRDDPDAAAYVVTVLGSTWSLDLCDRHRAALIDPLADVAERLGEAVKPGGSQAGKASGKGGDGGARPTAEPCLVCDHRSPTISALLMHIRTKHQTNLEALYGTTCPLCNETYVKASGLGGHIGKAHPVVAATLGGPSVPEAFRYASEHGDPHGVVAKVLADNGRKALPKRAAR